MQARGYSLVEMIVVTGMVSVLLGIATLSFNSWFSRYKSEAQTRMMYDDLMTARADAMFHRRITRVKISTTRFDVYSSLSDDDSGVGPVVSRQLQYPLMEGKRFINFDERGITPQWCSLCIADGYSTGAADSVTIGDTRIRIGKRTAGQSCNADNIDYQ